MFQSMYLNLTVAIVTSYYIFRCPKVSILIENIYISNHNCNENVIIVRFCDNNDVFSFIDRISVLSERNFVRYDLSIIHIQYPCTISNANGLISLPCPCLLICDTCLLLGLSFDMALTANIL